MIMDNTKAGGIIGALSVLVAALGGTIFLTPDQLDHAYVCNVSKSVGVFDRLSSTMKTGYYNDTGVEKSKVCTGGTWQPLRKYAADNGIEINVLLQNMNGLPEETPQQPPAGSQYCCGQVRPCDVGPCEVIQA